jgi:monoterpene epsilon-lactone hydrolase
MQSLKSRFFYWILKYQLAKVAKLDLSVQQSREIETRNLGALKMPRTVAAETGLLAGCKAEWYRPEALQTDGILLYLHGGAYAMCSIATHRTLAARLAQEAGCATVLMEYRLAPEQPFPAGLDDAFAAYLELQRQHRGVPIAIAGDSAGGGLSLALALRIRQEAVTPPAALALLSPWTDLTLSHASHRTKASVDPFFPDSVVPHKLAAMYAGSHSLTDPLISPLFADLGGMPPTLIHVGELEVLLDDSLMLAQRMSAQGSKVTLKLWPRMWHVWQIFAGMFREADQSVAELGAFLRTHLQAARA